MGLPIIIIVPVILIAFPVVIMAFPAITRHYPSTPVITRCRYAFDEFSFPFFFELHLLLFNDLFIRFIKQKGISVL